MSHELTVVDPHTLAVIQDTPIWELFKPLEQEILLDDTKIAGTTHLEDQTPLEQMQPGNWLWMQREDNPADPRAIVLLDAQGRKCGYVPRVHNKIFSRLLDAGKLLKAKVTEIDAHEQQTRRRGKHVYYEVYIEIYLVDF